MRYADRRREAARRKAEELLGVIDAMQLIAGAQLPDAGISRILVPLAALDDLIARQGHPFLSARERDALRAFRDVLAAFRAQWEDQWPLVRYAYDIPRLAGWRELALSASEALGVFAPRRTVLAVELGRLRSV